MPPEIGQIVTYRGLRCRIKRVAGDMCILTVLDPAPLSLRDELREPVRLAELDPPPKIGVTEL
jgi:hypothetical protein